MIAERAIQKGTTLTRRFVDQHSTFFRNTLNNWILRPDLLLDLIQPIEDAKNFKLTFYQRIALRAHMRYRYHFFTATRATSKSFTAFLSSFCRAMLLPNSQVVIAADVKGTVVEVAKQKFNEIFSHWPLLRRELTSQSEDGIKGERKSSDYYELNLKNGSRIFVISKNSRGIRGNAAIIEEAATLGESPYNEIILPILNVARREVDGTLNSDEPLSPQTFITTAATKTCFMFSKLAEIAAMAVLRPDEYFVWGMDYRVPVYYGVLQKQQLEEQRYSSTMSDEAFARESLSIWTGNSSDAWFDSKILARRRTLLHAERKKCENPRNPDTYYMMAVDVARYQANTVILVFKVLPSKTLYRKHLVYMEVIHGENFNTHQAPAIKRIAAAFDPREIVIDGNGLGSGLLDAMSLPSLDRTTGLTYPAYYVFNNNEHPAPGRRGVSDIPHPQSNSIIYDMRANASLNSEMHSNAFVQINSGTVSFLADERIVKEKFLATEKGRQMPPYNRHLYLLPYENTTQLMNEINNLRIKTDSSGSQISVEQITKSIKKDRFSAFEYGLWRIKYYEDKTTRHHKSRNLSDCLFFSPRVRK